MSDPLKDLSDLRKLFPGMEDYVPEESASDIGPEETTLSAKEKAGMKLYVSRDKKQRAGKTVTLVEGFTGPDEMATAMLSKLKSLCATGGIAKEGTLQLQGDHVRKVMDWLAREGYKHVKQKGG